MSTVAKEQLRSIVERIERITEEIKAAQEDRNEVYAEAVGNGFDKKALQSLIRRRSMDTADRESQDAMLDLYESTIGL